MDGNGVLWFVEIRCLGILSSPWVQKDDTKESYKVEYSRSDFKERPNQLDIEIERVD